MSIIFIGNLSLSASLLLILIFFIKPVFPRLVIIGQFLFISLSFLSLIVGFVITDLNIQLVSLHSHPFLPFFYRLAGTWANHEGSMLLWLWILSFYNLIFYHFIKQIKPLYIQFLISVGMILYILIASNPFTVNQYKGLAFGLNPILQDIALAIHPPILYLGYVGFSTVFSYALHLLLSQETKKKDFIILQFWASFSWSFLTLGIIIGSWWAYRELGWGGFWFWDPVENVALIPWLIATALLHSNLIVLKRNVLKLWTIFLSTLTFILCLIGTFLVRSGILSSVHSFASDPERGTFILIYIGILSIFAIYLFIKRMRRLLNFEYSFAIVEKFIIINNLLFMTAALTLLIGTIFPLIYNFIYNQSISVAAPYYNSTILPILILISSLAALVPFVYKGKGSNLESIKLGFLIIFSLLATYGITRLKKLSPIEMMGFSIGLFLTISMITEFYQRYKKNNITKSFQRLFYSHIGVGILSFAISLNSSFSQEFDLNLKERETFKFQNFTLKLNKIIFEVNKNHFTKKANFSIYDKLNEKSRLTPEVRLYPIEQRQSLETAIYYNLWYDIYLAISDIGEEDKVKLLIYYKPAMLWIWLSGILIVLAGFTTSFHYYQKKKELE